MTISYPLALPTVTGFRSLSITARNIIGKSVSPFTLETQIAVHQGQAWQAAITLPAMKRAAAEEWIGFLQALAGSYGTFYMGDPVNTAPRGTWAGSPKVLGSHAARVSSIAMDGFTAAATVKRGDWFQTGTGSNTHLHKVTQDATADGSGLLTLEVWPRTRAALADNDTFTTSNPVGLWRLASNDLEYSIEVAQWYGITFTAEEAL